MRKQMLFIATEMIFVLALATIAAADDSHDGTWKVNVTKSKYNPGPAPKSLTTKRGAQSNGMIKTIFDGVDADGKAIHYEYTAKLDGKDYPVIGNPGFDGITLKQADANTIDWVIKKSGKEVGHGRTVYSKDGKTRMQTEKGKDAKGQDYNNTVVYDKQQN
jgi:hypothetical protein